MGVLYGLMVPTEKPPSLPEPMLSPIRSKLLFIVALLLPAVGLAQDRVTVETIDGQKVSGVLNQIDADGNLVGQGFEGVNVEQLLSIAPTQQGTTPRAGSIKLGLVDGGQLLVEDISVDGETIQFRRTPVGLESVSLQAVRSIVLQDSETIREALAEPATDQDTVIVATSSSLARVSGVLESLDAEKLQLNFEGKSRPIKREKIRAVVIADADLDPPTGIMASVSFIDGSFIKGALVGFDDQAVTIELSAKQQIAVARKFLSRLDIASDSIAYLSTLEPIDVVQQPQFVVARPWQKNSSIEGNPLRLKVATKESETNATEIKTFASGIGTSSFSRLVFENTNEFSRLMVTAGIDAETNGRGDCVMRIEGDGIKLWSKRVRGNDTAVEVDVDISGISQIALIVDPGEQFDLADHADWAKARFLKTK